MDPQLSPVAGGASDGGIVSSDDVLGDHLTLIGLGEDGYISDAARMYLAEAEVVYGSARHFELTGCLAGKEKAWPSPFSAVYDELNALRGRPVAAG